MKTLELNQMEELVGGLDWGCTFSTVGLLAGALAVGAVTGGVGIALWAVGMGSSLGGMMTSCTP